MKAAPGLSTKPILWKKEISLPGTTSQGMAAGVALLLQMLLAWGFLVGSRGT